MSRSKKMRRLVALVRRRPLVSVATLLAALALPAAVLGMRFGYEHARYEVVGEVDGLELRSYAPRIVAEVRVDAEDPQEASRQGFKILAGYIFGDNDVRERIAMTAPVDRREGQRIAMTTPVDRQRSSDGWAIAFTMPAEYELDELPRPRDPRIVLRELPARRFVAQRFNGSPSEAEVQRRMAQLVEQVRARGLEPAPQPPSYARYDPPWTPSLLRRNEILVPLDS